jgi:HK97 gp10 family phage protein
MTVTGAEAIAAKFAAAAKVVPTVAVPSGLTKCGLLVTRVAKQKAPVDTGNLKLSIFMDPVSPVEVDVASPAEYSVYVEYGTSAHEIRPTNGKALFWPGAAHPVAVVHHPGTTAQPYMRPALDESKPAIEALLGVSVITAIESVV